MGDFRRPPRKTIPLEILRRITKLYVSNLPDRCSGSDLAAVLRGHGDIYDIYIAKKRDKVGNRFGFVSFLDVKDKEEMIRNMKSIRLGDYKLSINVARFVFEEGEIRDPPIPSKPVKEPAANDSANSFGGKQTRYEKTGIFSFKEALTGKRSYDSDNSKVLRLGETPSLFNDLHGRTLLVKVGSIDLVRGFQRELSEMGLGEGEIRYIGGFQFMVSFNNAEHATMAMDELLGRKEEFVSVIIWNGQDVEFERRVNILGLPIQLFDSKNIESVARLFGTVVHKPVIDPKGVDLSGGLVGILVNSGALINGEVSVLWNEKM